MRGGRGCLDVRGARPVSTAVRSSARLGSAHPIPPPASRGAVAAGGQGRAVTAWRCGGRLRAPPAQGGALGGAGTPGPLREEGEGRSGVGGFSPAWGRGCCGRVPLAWSGAELRHSVSYALLQG